MLIGPYTFIRFATITCTIYYLGTNSDQSTLKKNIDLIRIFFYQRIRTRKWVIGKTLKIVNAEDKFYLPRLPTELLASAAPSE